MQIDKFTSKLQEALAEAKYNLEQIQRKQAYFIEFSAPAKLKQLKQEETLAKLKAKRLAREKAEGKQLTEVV